MRRLAAIVLVAGAALNPLRSLEAQVSMFGSSGMGYGSWSGEDYDNVQGGVLFDGVAGINTGKAKIGLGYMTNRYSPGSSDTEPITHSAYFAEIRWDFPQPSGAVPFVAVRYGRSTESGTFGSTKFSSKGKLSGTLAGVGWAVSEAVLLEASGVFALHRSSEVKLGGTALSGGTNNGTLMGLRFGVSVLLNNSPKK